MKSMLDNRLGVIADVHGNALALEAVLRDARQRGVVRLVDLGDTLYGPMQPLEAYRLFRGTHWVAGISGNQDRKIVEATAADLTSNRTLAFAVDALGRDPIEWLRLLPKTAQVDGELFLCHGTPLSDTIYLLEDVSSGLPLIRPEAEILELLGGVREPVILCGHSHIPRVVQLSNGQMIVNPGSVGLPAYDDDKPVKHFMETYSPHASYAILEKSRAGWDVALHRVAYDSNAAARQASSLGAGDWAMGLSTGRMRDLREHQAIP
jgi:diadenosine tetraphosphatase ApaH/serine/threonine PP2A family protein phosphatase